MSMNYVPMVVHRSFDSDVPVYLFENEDEAKAEIRRQLDEEKRVQIEESEHTEGEDLFVDIADDGSWASLTILLGDAWDSEKDVIEWAIGDLKHQNVLKTKEKNTDKVQVIVTARDGVVQAVESSLGKRQIDVTVVDWDDYDDENDPDGSGFKEIKKELAKIRGENHMKVVW